MKCSFSIASEKIFRGLTGGKCNAYFYCIGGKFWEMAKVFSHWEILTECWLRRRRTLAQRPVCCGSVLLFYAVCRSVWGFPIGRWLNTIWASSVAWRQHCRERGFKLCVSDAKAHPMAFRWTRPMCLRGFLDRPMDFIGASDAPFNHSVDWLCDC
jgi:hypothetical protein